MNQEDVFRTLANNASDGVIIVSDTGRHLYVNQAMADMLGYSIPELMKLSIAELMLPDDLPAHRERLQRRLNGEDIPARYEVVMRSKEGKHLQMEITAGLTRLDGRRAIFGLFRDVTERRRTEEALRRSEQTLRAVIDNTPGCVYHYEVTDGKRREMIFVDPGLSLLLGPTITASLENRAERFIELIHPDDREVLWPMGIFNPDDNSPVDIEYRIRTERGYRWIRSIARAYPIDDRTVRWYGVFLDIDDRKRAAERLERMDRLETVGTIAGSIAHEVHNALFPGMTAIDKVKQLLASDRLPDPERLTRLLALTEGAVSRAFEMTRSISQFARLAAEDTIEEIALKDLVDGLLAEIPAVKQHNIETILDIDDSFTVHMNRSHASSLLGNLLTNAADALQNAPVRKLTMRAASTSNETTIAITDTGHGVDSELITRVFEPFFTTKQNHGTGLGLAVCRRIVDLYHGEISVDSPPGSGATFTITLPKST